MSNVAHMPAHKALNIDNFHDAAVKVGMYKNAVTAFMHPYTLGALETSIRKTGGAISRSSTCGGLIPSDGNLYYRDVTLVAREFWSKDDVTFCVDQAAGLKDAYARGAIGVKGPSPEWQAAWDMIWSNEVLTAIEAAEVNDVTCELELSKARQEPYDAAKEALKALKARFGGKYELTCFSDSGQISFKLLH